MHRGAVTKPVPTTAITPSKGAAATHPAHVLVVWVPVSDASSATWLKFFDTDPKWRMVLAVSPRFKRLSQDPAMRAKIQALQKANRLELALQLPNAPFLPLLVDSNAAKDALPPGAPLPTPPFAYPEDVVQMIASAKADFYRQWHALPRGLVLPYGAASPALLALLDKQGFTWVIAALGAPATDGPYKTGSIQVWDAAPSGGKSVLETHVLDERIMKDRSIVSVWTKQLDASSASAVLPSDGGILEQPLSPNIHWGRRTWTGRDWSGWIGTPDKNNGWNSLRRAREALENYKNSGEASVKKLDAAFEEMYTAENSNYLLALGNTAMSPATVEERAHELQATLGAVYRIIGHPAPDDLFSRGAPAASAAVRVSSTSAISETLPDGTVHVSFEDPAGDDHGDGHLPDPPGHSAAGSYDLRKLDVVASSDNVKFSIELGAMPSSGLGQGKTPAPLIDVYIDLNHQPNIGTLPLLPGRKLNASVDDAWEYAITLTGAHAIVYRTQTASEFEQAGLFPMIVHGNAVEFTLPRAVLRGSPERWGYQALVMALAPASTPVNPQPYRAPSSSDKLPPVYDLLDPVEAPQAKLLSDVSAGNRQDIPFVHPRPANP